MENNHMIELNYCTLYMGIHGCKYLTNKVKKNSNILLRQLIYCVFN